MVTLPVLAMAGVSRCSAYQCRVACSECERSSSRLWAGITTWTSLHCSMHTLLCRRKQAMCVITSAMAVH